MERLRGDRISIHLVTISTGLVIDNDMLSGWCGDNIGPHQFYR